MRKVEEDEEVEEEKENEELIRLFCPCRPQLVLLHQTTNSRSRTVCPCRPSLLRTLVTVQLLVYTYLCNSYNSNIANPQADCGGSKRRTCNCV